MAEPATNLAITAFACSIQNPDSLPKADRKLRIIYHLSKFRNKIRGYTPEQVLAACRYVVDGNDAALYEYPASRRDGSEEIPDEPLSVAAGVMYNGIALGLDISIDDAKKLTRSQYEEMVKNTLIR